MYRELHLVNLIKIYNLASNINWQVVESFVLLFTKVYRKTNSKILVSQKIALTQPFLSFFSRVILAKRT